MKNLAEIMRPIGSLIDSYSSVAEAAKKMKELNVGSIGVTSAGGLVALLTDRDIVDAVAENKDPNSTKLGQIVSGAPVSCRIGDSIEKAAELLSNHKLQRLVVKDNSDTPVGVLSLVDVVMTIAAEHNRICFDILQNAKSCG